MKTSILYSQIIFHKLWLGFWQWDLLVCMWSEGSHFKKAGKIFNLTLCKLLSRAIGVTMIQGGTAKILNEYSEKPSWFPDYGFQHWHVPLLESWAWLSLSSCLWAALLQSVIVPSATVALVFLDCLFAHLSYYGALSMTSQFASLCDVETLHLCFTNTDSALWHRNCQPGYFFRLFEAAKFWNKSFLFS